jgi:uncharacterized protein YutE (UPF0331/DUF86 family)
VPETGADSFEILAEAGLLPPPLATAPATMVGVPTFLAHDHTRIAPAIVVRVLRDDLEEIERFGRIAEALVRSRA